MHWTLAERELTHAAKKRHPYYLRSLAGAAAFAVALFAWMAGGGDWARGILNQAFPSLVIAVQFIGAFVVAPLSTSGAVAQERTEGTLDILLTASRSASDIVLAKYLAALLQCVSLILCPLPVVALAAILGGIDVPDAALQTIGFLAIAALNCAAGLLASILARGATEALFAAFVFEALWLAVYPLATYLWISHPHIVLMALATPYMAGDPWWVRLAGCVIWVLVACGIIALATALLPRRVHLPARGRFFLRKWRINRFRKRDPITALIYAQAIGPFGSSSILVRLAIAIGALAVTAASFLVVSCFGSAVTIPFFAYVLINNLRNLSSSGALDDLRLTPIEDQELAEGIYRVNRKRFMVFFPAIALVSLPISGIGAYTMTGIPGPNSLSLRPELYAVIFSALAVCTALANFAFLYALACESATQAGSATRASILTLVSYLIRRFLAMVPAGPVAFVIGEYLPTEVALTLFIGVFTLLLIVLSWHSKSRFLRRYIVSGQ